MKISSDLIPHNQFHLGSWLLPVEKPTWYYFLKHENNNQISNSSFMESVDEPLKILVHFLHQKGIKTTPSCSGHYRSIETYRNLYHELNADRLHIRNGGLQLKDIETGDTLWYRDQNYQLPWTCNDFLQKVMHYQQKGVLGMRIPEGSIKKEILALQPDKIQISEKDGIVLLEMDENNKRNNELNWKKITADIQHVFNKAA